jgi:hypothetical protein
VQNYQKELLILVNTLKVPVMGLVFIASLDVKSGTCLATGAVQPGRVSYNNTTPAFLKGCFWSEQWHSRSRSVYFMTSYACPFSSSSFPNIFLLQPYTTVPPHCTLKKATESLVVPQCHYSLRDVHYLSHIRACASPYCSWQVPASGHMETAQSAWHFRANNAPQIKLLPGCVEKAKSSLCAFSYLVPFLIRLTLLFSLALQPQFGPWPTSMKLSVSLRFSRS